MSLERSAFLANIGSFVIAAYLLVRGSIGGTNPLHIGFFVFWLVGAILAFVAIRRRRIRPPTTQVAGRTFQNETVHLDGNAYTACTFRDVTFRYRETAAFSFDQACVFDGVNRVMLTGSGADAVVELLKRTKLMSQDNWFRVIDPD